MTVTGSRKHRHTSCYNVYERRRYGETQREITAWDKSIKRERSLERLVKKISEGWIN